MNTPLLRHEFTLEAPDRVADGAGGYKETWTVLGRLWGDLRPLSGRERALEEIGVSQGSYDITVRAAPMDAPSRPTPRQRFRLGSRVFGIAHVREAGAEGRFLVCRTTEETAL